jgi:2-amino-4-hydroxy-6-hydroxymethyldihydropteridine diphosphokinase
VALLDSALSPHDLLSGLQEIEAAHERKREMRWGPRTLDLDIVAMDGDPVHTAKLEVPHPRASERRFVIEPLSEIWPEAMVGEGLSASAASELAKDQHVVLLATDWWEGDSEPAVD